MKIIFCSVFVLIILSSCYQIPSNERITKDDQFNLINYKNPGFGYIKTNCNVYDQLTPSMKIIYRIQNGSIVTILGRTNTYNKDYYKIKFNNLEGFVLEENIDSLWDHSDRIFILSDLKVINSKQKQLNEIIKKGEIIERFGVLWMKDKSYWVLKYHNKDKKSFADYETYLDFNCLSLNSRVTVLKEPDLSSDALTTIEPNTVFPVKAHLFNQFESNIKPFYYITINNQTGWIQTNGLVTNGVLINDIFYGIKLRDKPPREEFEDLKFEYESIIKYSLKEKRIVDEIILDNETDGIAKLSLSDTIIQNRKVLIVSYYWNHFTTSPIGYDGFRFYLLNNSGDIENKIFSYFSRIGAQDQPYAGLENTTFTPNKIALEYSYYDAVGMPNQGAGTIKLNYQFNEKANRFLIESKEININKLTKKMIYIKEIGDEIEQEVKEPLNYTINELNDKFKMLHPSDSFIYE